MMTRPAPPNPGFGELLRQVLVVEKRHALPTAAAALGLTAHTFCARLRNGGRFTPEDAATLLRTIDDERLPRWFFTGSGLLLLKHAKALSGSPTMPLRQTIAACAVDAIDAICGLADTLEPHTITTRQQAMVEERVDHALATLLSIQRHCQGPPGSRNPAPAGTYGTFASMVRQTILGQQHVRMNALAQALHLTYQALHARMSRDVPFLPSELRQIFRLFPDPQLADCLLAGTGYTAILRPAVIDSHITATPLHTGLGSLRDMVRALEALLLTDQPADAGVSERVSHHLAEAVRQLATLHWNMTFIGGPAARRTHAAGSNLAA